jgi:hypothetical protein
VNFEHAADGNAAVKVVLRSTRTCRSGSAPTRRPRSARSACSATATSRSRSGRRRAELEDGAEIRVANPANIARVIDTGTQALDNIATLAKNLNTVVVGFQGDKGSQGPRELGRIGERHPRRDPARPRPPAQPDLRRARGRRHGSLNSRSPRSRRSSTRSRTGNGLLHILVYEPLSRAGRVLEVLDAGSRLISILAKIDTARARSGSC